MDSARAVVFRQNSTCANTTFDISPVGELDKVNGGQVFHLIPSIVYTSTLMILGVIGNYIVLYVYFFKWRKSTSRVFILFLTGLDFINCVTSFPVEIFIMRYYLMFDNPWLCKLSRFGPYTMNSASAAILIGIAVDRYKRICRPHGIQFNAKQSTYICIFCIIGALIFTWPVIVLYGTREINLGNVVGYSCLVENKFDNSVFPVVYFCIMMGSSFLIFLTLSILYYFIGLQLFRIRKSREKRVSKTQDIIQKSCKRLTIGPQPSEVSNLVNAMNGFLIKTREIKHFIDAIKEDSETKRDETFKQGVKHQVPIIQIQNTCDEANEPILEKSEDNTCNDDSNTKNDDHACKNGSYLLSQPDDITDTTPIRSLSTDSIVSISTPRKDSKPTKEGFGDAGIKEHSDKPIKTPAHRLSIDSINSINTPRKDSVQSKVGPEDDDEVSYKCIRMYFRIGKSTLMLFLITLAYIFSFLPYYTVVIMRQSNQGFVGQLSDTGYMTYNVLLRSYQLSSAINPIIYSFCNRRFRSLAQGLFRRGSHT